MAWLGLLLPGCSNQKPAKNNKYIPARPPTSIDSSERQQSFAACVCPTCNKGQGWNSEGFGFFVSDTPEHRLFFPFALAPSYPGLLPTARRGDPQPAGPEPPLRHPAALLLGAAGTRTGRKGRLSGSGSNRWVAKGVWGSKWPCRVQGRIFCVGSELLSRAGSLNPMLSLALLLVLLFGVVGTFTSGLLKSKAREK